MVIKSEDTTDKSEGNHIISFEIITGRSKTTTSLHYHTDQIGCNAISLQPAALAV